LGYLLCGFLSDVEVWDAGEGASIFKSV